LAIDPSSSSEESRSLIEQAEPVVFLLEQLALLRRWPSRLACMESLEATLHAIGVPDSRIGGGHRMESPHHHVSELRDQLLVIGRDRNDHEWVQARAIACLRLVDL